MLNAISSAKNELIPPAEYSVQTYYDEIVARAYARYQDTLRKNDGLDFDDLLMETAKLLRNDPFTREKYRNRYRYLLVDEFQDTNMAQYVILQLLAQDHHSLYVVADEDQSIYSWRGADYATSSDCARIFLKCSNTCWSENYRSTQVIWMARRPSSRPIPIAPPNTHAQTRRRSSSSTKLSTNKRKPTHRP